MILIKNMPEKFFEKQQIYLLFFLQNNKIFTEIIFVEFFLYKNYNQEKL